MPSPQIEFDRPTAPIRLGVVLHGSDALGGVTTWANTLADNRKPNFSVTAIIMVRHSSKIEIDPHVSPEFSDKILVELPNRCRGAWELECRFHTLDFYRETARAVAGKVDILIPNQFEYGFKLGAAMIMLGLDIRLLGMCHTDEPYYYHLLKKYRNITSRIVSVCKTSHTRLASMSLTSTYLPYALGPDVSEAHDRDRDSFRIAYVGRLVERQKKISRLADLMRFVNQQCAGTEIAIVGDGDELLSLKTQLRRIGVKARFTGAVSRPAVFDILSDMHCFVLVSETEGTPIAMLEAMSKGVPPVVPRVAGMLDVIEDGVNGFLYEEGSMHAAAAVVARLHADRDLLAAVGRKAQLTVQRDYNLFAYRRKFESIVKETLALDAPGKGHALTALLDRTQMQWATSGSVQTDASILF